STSKDFVFIDKGVNDYESLVHSIGSSKQIFIIDSNKDGFIEIQNILQGKSNLDSVHLIGHGSAGQIIFGNTILSSENLNQYTDALRVIGSALTTSGDILFYGCNIAQTETGELLIQQIGNITQADIAASTDLTGKNGDWDLEHKIGSIESESLVFEEFNGTLDSYGVDSINSNVVAIHNATNFKARWSGGSGNNGGQLDSSSDRFIITMERQNITNSGGTLVFDQAGTNSTYTASSTNKINSYLIYLNDETNRRSSANAGSVTFDNDILGYYTAWSSTIDNNYLDKSGATYPTSSATKVSKRIFESFTTSQTSSRDWAYLTGDKTITFGANNGQKGDFIRVITKAAASNTAPVASYDYAVINEDASFSVSDGAGENKVGYYDSSGENTGDILDSDNSSYDDTDADGDSLTITSVRIGRVENSGTAGTLGQALTGTYGQLTLNANGSYSYSANQNAADTLDSGDSVYDYFNYTVSDGTDTDSAVIRIQVKGINDDITAVNDFDAVNEDATITRSASSSYSVDYDDTDADGDDNYTNFTITAIKTGHTEGSGTAGTVGQALTGTYGTLTINADGSYSYVADQAAADDLDAGDTANDYFNYTVSDGTDTDIAVLRITVTGINDAPVAQNDVGVINEDATLTVSNSANANVSGSYDATGEHSGDVINTSSSSYTDSDPDDSASLVVSAIRTGGTEGSGTAGSIGSALTGTYGQLTIAANGSYSYVANQSAADDLDAGDSATDVFNYTLSDGTATDIGTITITVLGLNDPVVAVNDTGSVNEDATLTVSDGSGDIIANNDTDADDSASLVVSAIRLGGTEGSGTAGTLGQALTGTYGQLTLNANGSYTYVANQAAADALDANDTATDVFNYTVTDGTSSDTATITITVTGINDPVVATNDTGSVNEDATLTVSDGSGDIIANNDTDADDSASLVVSAIRLGGTEGSGTAGTLGQALTGTYGQLTLNANGSYTYVANQAAADALDANDTATDVFNYTLSDGTATDTATITITVTGINDAPVAQNDVGVINEDATLTVSNSANANVSGSYDATGEHSGDVINTSSSSHTDSDPDDSASLVVSAIRLGSSEGSGTAGTLGSALTGTYGTLTMNANGSYTYVADQAAADNLNAGQSATDSFNYTLSDGTATDIGVIQISVLGLNNDSSNAAPSATNDTDAVNANETITRSDGSSQDVQRDDTDSDGDTLTVSAIRTGAESGSGTSGSVGSALTGTYGTLTLNANGSYSYVADQDAADSISDGATATDTFTYTITDGDKTDTAEIVITVTGTNFVAVNDTDSVNEDATVTATDGSSTDVITDDSGSGTLVVSAIRLGGTEGSGTAGTVGSALTGTYGTLTLNANGSYSYVADQAAADALDANDTATDVFNYTLSNGSSTDTATLTITVTGINDPVVATNDTGSVNED
ncbi:VCBS domain-containing protein, partial [Alphaproteobacteria bacterium]|nr:VCBS domain-containing protein [Alphaproteobacteria bacterium]